MKVINDEMLETPKKKTSRSKSQGSKSIIMTRKDSVLLKS